MAARGTQTPLIWALDLATVTGIATGRVGEKPNAFSIRFAPAHASTDLLFGACYDWFAALLGSETHPDILAIEELLPPTARRGFTNTGAQHRLAGLHGIVRAMATSVGIGEVVTVSVADIRQHFIHHRTLKSVEAKRAVAKMCSMLGWPATDSDACDALALWSYTSATINPAHGLATTPLFATWDEVARTRQAKAR